MKQYALRFISGKYEGGEFSLPSNAETIIGRSSDLDLVLVEDMVSRQHTKIAVDGDQVLIEDLGSTNGTFVNGERIKRAIIEEGDRILIGTSIIKLIANDTNVEVSSSASQLEDMAAHRRTSQVRSMSGTIDEIPVPDLLQLFSSSRKTALLVVKTENDTGKIFLQEGNIVFASINDSEQLTPMKCLGRILAWGHGTFYLEPPGGEEFPNGTNHPVESVLMESMRIIDEVHRQGENLPPMEATLSLVRPLEAKLKDLSPEELDVIQSAINHPLVESMFNNCAIGDIRIAQILVSLIVKRYLRVDKPGEL